MGISSARKQILPSCSYNNRDLVNKGRVRWWSCRRGAGNIFCEEGILSACSYNKRDLITREESGGTVAGEEHELFFARRESCWHAIIVRGT